MKGARLLALALLALTTTACEPHRRPGALPVCDVEDGYHRGDFELIVDPSASYGDDGAAYAPTLAGRYIVAAIDLAGPAGTEPPLYVYSAGLDSFFYCITLDGYGLGRSNEARYAKIIGAATERLYPSRPGATAPDASQRQIRRLTDRARRAFNADPLRVGGAACLAAVLAVALVCWLILAVVDAVIGTITPILVTVSDISAKHRLISHANALLRSKRRKGGSK